MNETDFYKLKTMLKKGRDMIERIKASKLRLRHDGWELIDFRLSPQYDKLREEHREFDTAFFEYMRFPHRGSGIALLREVADCQNVLDGIAYLVGKELGEFK